MKTCLFSERMIPMGMKLSIRRFKHVLAACCVLAGSLVLGSCGGGAAALISGVGSGGTGLVEGLVVGFGSVFIDGQEYATTTATIQQDNDLGQAENALLKLGQRVRATIDSSGTAVVTALVIPSLSGPVTLAATQDAQGDWWAQVLGQWIHIVSNATHTPVGLTTVIAGANNASGLSPNAQLALGNEVEVHGIWAWDTAHNAYVLVASRVEMLSYTPLVTNVLVGGVVTSLPATNEVMINAASGTLLRGTVPTGVAVGGYVSAWVTSAAWNAWPGNGAPLDPYIINLAGLAAQSVSADQKAQLSGLVSNYNPATNTATVQGTTVTIPSGSHVGDGDYIRLTGQVNAGVLTQTTVNDDVSSNAAVTPQSIQVLGTTNGIGWNAGGDVSFVLQGTSVLAPANSYASCANLTNMDTVSVDVTGTVPAPGQPVVASAVTCTQVTSPPSGSVSDFRGLIVAVNGNSLTLQNEDRILNVTWTSTTFIDPALGTAGSTWVGLRVEVIGTLSGTALSAAVIRSGNGGTND